MDKLGMSTKISFGGEKLSVKDFAVRRLEEVSSYGTEQFVIVGDDAYLDNNSSGGASYFAHAVRLGDAITDGEAPLYLVEFEIINPDTEDGNNACDWSIVHNYEQIDTVEII